MGLNARLFALHRWIGLFVAAQLLAWSAGGLIFSLSSSAVLSASNLRNSVSPRPVPLASLLSPAIAVNRGSDRFPVTSVELSYGRGRWLYTLRASPGDALVMDATTGEALPMLMPKEAELIAQGDFRQPHRVLDVRLFDRERPVEYRKGPMPVYRVRIDAPGEPHLFVNALTGTIEASRTAMWRIYDFFWMLHIMDYGGRVDIHHGLLTLASAIAVLSAVSGSRYGGDEAGASCGVSIAQMMRKLAANEVAGPLFGTVLPSRTAVVSALRRA